MPLFCPISFRSFSSVEIANRQRGMSNDDCKVGDVVGRFMQRTGSVSATTSLHGGYNPVNVFCMQQEYYLEIEC